MKRQKYGEPTVSFSWFLREGEYTKEHYKTTLESDEGRKQLLDSILLCIDQEYEIRIGTDGECLILEANYADDEYSDSSYQYIDDSHFVGELTEEGNYPDYYSDKVDHVLEDIKTAISKIDFDKLTKKELKETVLSLIN